MTMTPLPPPDISTLPMPQYGLYVQHRGFKQHPNLGQVKARLSREVLRDHFDKETSQWQLEARSSAFVYQFIDGSWVLIHTIHPGDMKHEHPLWAPDYVIQELQEPSDVKARRVRKR